MERRTFLVAGMATVLASTLGVRAEADTGPVMTLPAPDRSGGRPLLTCLNERHTDRHLSGEDIPLPVLSTLLWAAFGVNRKDGRHVVPTARNSQQVKLYAVLGDGVWLYLPEKNAIQKVLDGDQRRRFDGSALILLYAAPSGDEFAGMHVGSMYQNVGLYCASERLPNCVKYQRHEALSQDLPLPKGWKVMITQSIGPVAR